MCARAVRRTNLRRRMRIEKHEDAIRTSNIVKVNDDHAPFTKAGLFRNGGYIPLLAVKGNHRETGGKRVNVTNRGFPFR